MPRIAVWAIAIALITCSLASNVQAQGQTPTILFLPSGWNLVAGRGAVFGCNYGPDLYTLQPGDSAYRTVSLGSALQSGLGYWLYVPEDTRVALRAGSNSPYQVNAPAGQYILLGDPSGTQAASVSGADAVYVYDRTNGYQQTTTLSPGQGAWAVSNGGGMITVTPGAAAPGSAGAADTCSASPLSTTLRATALLSTSGSAGLTPGSFQTITGPRGYQFQVPTITWEQVPSSCLIRPESGTGTLDAEARSFINIAPGPNGSQAVVATQPRYAYVDILKAPPGFTSSGLAEFAKAFLDNLGQGIQGSGGSSIRVIDGPASVDIRGAEAGVAAAGSYTDSQGNAYVQAIRVALRGQTLYVFTLDVPRPFYLSDPNFSKVYNSFELTGATAPSSATP